MTSSVPQGITPDQPEHRSKLGKMMGKIIPPAEMQHALLHKIMETIVCDVKLKGHTL